LAQDAVLPLDNARRDEQHVVGRAAQPSNSGAQVVADDVKVGLVQPEVLHERPVALVNASPDLPKSD